MSLKRKTPLRQKASMKRGKKPLPLSEVTKRFNIVTAAMLGEPKPHKPLRKRAPGNNKQIAMFREVWAEREPVCFVCGYPLIDPPDNPREEPEAMQAWVSQFAHVLNKGHYRAWKNKKENILLLCRGHHAMFDTVNKDVLRERPFWGPAFKLYDRLKAEANGCSEG